MIGIQNVSSTLLLTYHLATLTIMALFSLYDLRHHKVKNKSLLWFLPWCLLPLLIYGIAPSLNLLPQIINMAMGFLCGGFLLFTISIFTKGSIGGGDIKITALLGLIYLTDGILTILLVASSSALLYTLSTGKKTIHLPFVPFLWVGCIFLLYIYFNLDNC